MFKGLRDTKKEILKNYATDASAFRVLPTEVVYPKTVADVVAVVAEMQEKKKQDPEMTLSVRAGGTCMSGGSLNTGMVMDMTRYMNTVRVDPMTQTAIVEAGAYFRDIEDAAAAHGLMFAPYPSSHRICGIGGMLGNNASGEKSLRYGATIDNVLELEVVLATGEVITTQIQDRWSVTHPRDKEIIKLFDDYHESLAAAQGKVSKLASGYRIDRVLTPEGYTSLPLFIGAQGTLGIITKAKLQLVPIPKYTRLVLACVDRLSDLPHILESISALHPECIETFDKNTYRRAELYQIPDALVVQPFWKKNTELIILIQSSEATQEETDTHAQHIVEVLNQQAVAAVYIDDAVVADAAWNIRRSSFLLMRDHNEVGFRAIPCIEDVIVPINRFDVFIPELQKILAYHALSYGFHGHIGEGSLRIIPVFDITDPLVAQKVIALTKDVFALVKSLEGNMSADHSDGIIRSPFLKDFYGPELFELFVAIKDIFDPDRIFNAHKKTESSLDYIAKYLDR